MTSYDTTPVPTGKGAASFWRGSWWFQADFDFFLFFNSQKSGISSQKVESSPKLLGENFTNREVFEATTNTVGKLPKFFCPHDAKVMFIGGGASIPNVTCSTPAPKMLVVSGSRWFLSCKNCLLHSRSLDFLQLLTEFGVFSSMMKCT